MTAAGLPQMLVRNREASEAQHLVLVIRIIIIIIMN
jgi:hypothetical protein